MRGVAFAGLTAMLFLGALGWAVWSVWPGESGAAVGSQLRPNGGGDGGGSHTRFGRYGRGLLNSELSGSGNGSGVCMEHHEPPAYIQQLEDVDYEQHNYKALFVILYILGIYNMFLGIAILCDEFFLEALEGITNALGLPEDVAGATFMAAGQSERYVSCCLRCSALCRRSLPPPSTAIVARSQ
jgi:hypothetical protein